MRDFIASVMFVCLAVFTATAETLQEKLTTCLACHGEKGQSQKPEVPSLGGQPTDFLLIQMVVFRDKLRKVEPMNEVMKHFTNDDLRTASTVFARLPAPAPIADAGDPTRMERAQALVAQHRCNFCHTSNFAGQDQVPRLAGQREDYLLKALREYKSNERAGYDAAMANVVQPMKDEEFVDLAYYLARLK